MKPEAAPEYDSHRLNIRTYRICFAPLHSVLENDVIMYEADL